MTTVYDVPADKLIKRMAMYLRENTSEITPPSWFMFVKTSSHLENPPQDPDFWYTRCASILRKIYVNRNMGIDTLRSEYGGRTNRGNVGKHKRKSGGAIIRNCLKQLEAANLVNQIPKIGRSLTNIGTSLLDSLATEVQRELEKEIPGLKKYG